MKKGFIERHLPLKIFTEVDEELGIFNPLIIPKGKFQPEKITINVDLKHNNSLSISNEIDEKTNENTE